MSDPRRWLASFLTGETDVDDTSTAQPQTAAARRATRVARPVGAAVPAGQQPQEPVAGNRVALPDFVDPPGGELVAGVDANGVEYVFEDDPYADPLVDPRYDADDRNWVRYRPNWGGYLRFVILGLLIVFFIFWVRARIYNWIDGEIVPDGPRGEAVEFIIPNGASTNDVASQLAGDDIIGNATVFRYWLRCDGDITITGFLGCDTEHSFQAGEYELFENMAFEDIVAVFEEGPAPEVLFKITIPEGLRVNEFVDRALEENDRFTRDDMTAAIFNPEYISEYLPPEVDAFHWYEGLLFPATYDIPEGDLGDEGKFVDRMSNTFDARFGALIEEHGRDPVIDELGLTDYEIVIIASLIEEEAKTDEDRGKMARGIYNRLQQGERLRIDATTYYAVNKSFTEPLLQSDLDTPSAWNTYQVDGLPPTPIAAPGEASLLAALQPEDGDWIFWVRTEVDGGHTFSVTQAEHDAAVAICREREFGC